MLKVLKRIVQDVTTVSDLTDALHTLVVRVREAISADAATVYLIDQKRSEYVLIATDGLDKNAESVVRVALDNGLIGMVGRREEPINIDHAQEHPAFHRDPLLDEGDMNAFLGVPIIQHRHLYGVLMIQRRDDRCFDDAEEAFLITLAAQLGGMLSHADATGELASLTQMPSKGVKSTEANQLILNGLGCVSGIAIGTAVVIYPAADIEAVPRRMTEDVEEEVKLFYIGLKKARDTMANLKNMFD